jgi:hypothetical protein
MGKWRQRAVSSWGCLLYSAFCLTTARLVVQTQPAQTAQSEQRQDTGVTADLLRTGWGRLLLILVGVIVVVAGVEMGRRSVRLDFRERFTAEHMPRALAIVTRALGAVGCVARAVVFVLVGVFLLKAAVLSSAKQVKGLDAVFRSVASSAYGSWLLAVLASGLLCYGFYCLLEARYRDLTPGRWGAAADSCSGWHLRAPDSCRAGAGRHRRSLMTVSDQQSPIACLTRQHASASIHAKPAGAGPPADMSPSGPDPAALRTGPGEAAVQHDGSAGDGRPPSAGQTMRPERAEGRTGQNRTAAPGRL